MAKAAQWVTFDSDSDEALSLSDLPIAKQENNKPKEESESSPAKDDQFEFRILAGGGNQSSGDLVDMCAAEDVFSHGQIMPLGPAQPVSRSHSTASLSFDSAASVSRSLSSSSSDAPHAVSLLGIRSNTLCAYPSPSPRVRCAGGNRRRRSTGSAPSVGWGLLRLGVAMAPEMEMSDIRVRLGKAASVKSVDKRGGAVWRLVGGGMMGCKCSPEDAVSATAWNAKKKEERRRKVAAGLSERRERMFEWLEELSIGKEPLMKFGL